MEKLLFTSESVTEGHPDKICDQISDAILDALLEQDPMSRVACETCTTTGLILVMGEITSKANINIQKIVRDTVREIGYTRGKYGFDAETAQQLLTIKQGIDKKFPTSSQEFRDYIFLRVVGAAYYNDFKWKETAGYLKNYFFDEVVSSPSTVEKIDAGIFSGCNNLTSVYIPLSVVTIGEYVFNGCTKLNIECERNEDEIPSTWNKYWNSDKRPVTYGVKK